MSIESIIRCDGCGDVAPMAAPAKKGWHARQAAQSSGGWMTDSLSRDWCPKCSPERIVRYRLGAAVGPESVREQTKK